MAEQKVVIVTGAGSGMGAATAKRFAKDGYKVVINGRTQSKLQKVADEIGGDEVLIVAGDISNPEDAANIVQQTIDSFGRLDVLVNNAAIAIFSAIEDLSLEDWNKQLSINTTGPFLMIKNAISHLEKSKGSIVNVSSVSGLGGDWNGFAYDATKGAVNIMTQALALDFAAKGVRVNAVAPSLTDTDMAAMVTQDPETLEKFKTRIAMKRVGQPEEVADVIAFLASHDARFVTGTILPVDGGLSASNGQPNMSE
ncbi:MAG: 3-oxoacyl-ACP reductase [Micavibrio sp. TMED27]|nr:3-oxoacyl-ACP reductase [Micavibrio sp.]OUT91589.1 MAG: 3-oxoacyl-ACP reductase [Micavibrio sp. TMED27]|tara:strand:+ start:1055 stop:1816 length:762 start_codon:yes stop_codon:yes gene_type:complete